MKSLHAVVACLAAPVGLLFVVAPAAGQTAVPWTPSDQVVPSVRADVAFDAASGLYTYSYTLESGPGSAQDISFFGLKCDGTIVNPESPDGWTFARHTDRPIVSWAATKVDPLPPDYVDDGNIPPSPYAIKPGARLSGFRFRSSDPPGTVTSYVQGHTSIPTIDGDDDLEVPDFTEDSVSGPATGPVPINEAQYFAGGRSPGADGFLVFLNISDDVTKAAPVGIVVKFGMGGETVDQTTFTATLNSIDVTGSFVPNGRPGELVAIFDIGASPLEPGRNVLLTSVKGIVPATQRTATDIDRLTFTVQ